MPTTPERFKKIGELYHAATAIPVEHRREFLRNACGSDEELFEEVWSLLTADAERNSFMETRAIQGVAANENRSQARQQLIGRTFGSYELKSVLGAGGMGDV